MAKRAHELFKQARLYSDGRAYRIVHLPVAGVMAAAGALAQLREPFSALIVDKDEVTLVLAEDELHTFAARLKSHEVLPETYRLITFDLPLEPDVVGFMALVSTALAAAGVPIMPLAAFARDHVLVPASHYDAAFGALQKLRDMA
jgi:hypothetical protein